MFLEDVPYKFTGLAWLFMGVANSDAKLYDDEIQDKVEEYGDEIFDLLDGGAHMYFCGLKGMMPGILTMLEGVAKAKGLDWGEFLEKVKKNGQWHVEVY